MPSRFALLVLTALAGTPLIAAAETERQPNIVFILCDDLGYGDVQVLNPQRGKIPTPNLDRLAAEGMLFTDAHASASVCTPTRYGILTGRYCWRSRLQHGAISGHAKPIVDQKLLTVADFLKAQGYATICLGKWHLGVQYEDAEFTSRVTDGPLQHGFDHFFGITASLDMEPFAWIDDDRMTEAPTITKHFFRNGLAAPSFEAVDVLPTLTKKAIKFIKTRRQAAQPFFLYLPYASPHTPVVPTDEWKGKSGLGAYADFVMQNDAAIGDVLCALDEAGLRDNTIVYFGSDNGFAPAVHPQELEAQGHYPSGEFRGYKADIWEGGHRIPLMVRWPGVIEPGSKSDQLVSLTDLFATLADVLDQELPADAAVDSFSLLPLFKGGDQPVRQIDIEHSNYGYFAIREGHWKLELCAGSGGWSNPREARALERDLPKVQLYDLANDPGEQHNVQAQHPEIVERMMRLLKEAIANGRTTPGPKQANDAEIKIYKQPRQRS